MNKIHQNTNENLLSEVIEFLRFPLIVGVIFIHAYTGNSVIDRNIMTSDNYPFVFYISNLFSEVLARVAVPIYFFISGFLFFYKTDCFNRTIYFNKLKKRFKSLLIPYIFGNILMFLVYFYVLKAPLFSHFFNTPEESPNFIKGLIGLPAEDGGIYPFVHPFWFIRDLIVCVIISPVLFLIITKTRHIGIVLLGIGWYIGCEIPYIGIRGFSAVAIFFFSLGGWFSCHKKNFLITAKELKWLIIFYPMIIVLDLLTKGQMYNIYIYKLGICIGIIFWFLIASFLIERIHIKSIPFLTSASFFIFAIHEPWILPQVSKLLSYYHPNSEISVVFLYFSSVFLALIISAGLYYILIKIVPRFTLIITGGR